MREIKFRVWDTKEKEMLDNDVDEDFFIGRLLGIPDGLVYEQDYDSEDNVFFAEESGRYILLQYIGLQDKNGKDIYDGDIILLEGTKSIGKVYYIHGVWEIEWYYDLDGKRYTIAERDVDCVSNFNNYDSKPYSRIKMFEVLGNIYENPKLLEK